MSEQSLARHPSVFAGSEARESSTQVNAASIRNLSIISCDHRPSPLESPQYAYHGMSRTTSAVPLTEGEEKAELPCVFLPAHQNMKFFGRKKELDRISSYLQDETGAGLRSLAIHGIGGVGKTQTALAYAYSAHNYFDAIIWLAAETEIALSSSLSEAALQLKLPGADIGRPSTNPQLVLQWLQRTSCRWLLIYDNAEAGEFLNRTIPKANHGAILMTTRNVNISRVPCSAGHEIKSFDTDEGTEFLLNQLSLLDIGRQSVTPEMRSQARELSYQVGGHALALSQMVALIHSRSWALSECLELYKERPKALHNLTQEVMIDANYKFFINTVFKEALTGVRSTFSNTLLGILSFLVPDGIPQPLFEPKDRKSLPPSLQFCKDEFLFDDALRPLLTLALVGKESQGRHQRKLTVHRLVQREFSFYVDEEERQRLFEQTVFLLNCAFPARVAARFLHSRWAECQLYIQHVISLLDSWKSPGELPQLRAPVELCRLLSNAAWYIHESGEYELLNNFLESAFLVFEDQRIMEDAEMDFARLHMVAGVMRDNWGHFQRSIDSFMKCLNISLKYLDGNDEFVGGIYNDLGNVSESLGDFEQAISWHQKSWDIRALSPEPSGESIAHCKVNMARSMLMLGQDEKAFEMMEKSEIVFRNASAWFHQSHCNFCKGNFYLKRDQLDNAKREYQTALSLLLEKVKAKSHVRSSACLYKLAIIEAKRGDFVSALSLYRDSLSVCAKQKYNLGDRARILHAMSMAQCQIPGMEADAKTSIDEALELYQQLTQTRFSTEKDNPTAYDFDLLVCGLHR